MWAVYPMGCRQLAPRALEVSCDPRYIRSVVRPAWNGCWPVEWSIPGQGGRGGMGWGQFGWRGSQDRSPTVNHRLKKKKKKYQVPCWKKICQHHRAARTVLGPQWALPSACQMLFTPGGAHSQAQPSGLPVFASVTPPWVTSSSFYNSLPKQYPLSDGHLLTPF